MIKIPSFSRFLRLAVESKSIFKGKSIHGKIITSGYTPDVYTNNNLMSMYLKLNAIDYARKVFDEMPQRDFVSYTIFLTRCSQMGLANEGLDCLRLMVNEGLSLNEYSYVGGLSACASLRVVKSGKEIHGRLYRVCEEMRGYVGNGLVNFYGKCGLISYARSVFDSILDLDRVSWTCLVNGYFQCGEYIEGLKVFMLYREVEVSVDAFLSSSVLGACAVLGWLRFGMQVHGVIFKCGVRLDEFLVTAVINFYAKCGELDLAYQAFMEYDDPGTSAWNALIGGCAQEGRGGEATRLFCKLHRSGKSMNLRTFPSLLGAFSEKIEIDVGKQIHALIVKSGFHHVTTIDNTIIDFYAKCGLLEDSLKIFEEMDEHDIISWNVLISGYIRSGYYEEAVEHIFEMLVRGLEPSIFTYSIILAVCGHLPAMEWGRQTHCRIIKPGYDSNVVVNSALVDMYSKCGKLRLARTVFDNLSTKNLACWNAMLLGYAQHGYGKEALEIYEMMRNEGVKPDAITFTGVLSACGHIGLIDAGLEHFESMTKVYGISPEVDHVACMVSLFARNGRTRQAYEFIQNTPMKLNKVVWRCLLSGCKVHKDIDLARVATENILVIDPDDSSAYVMLANIYAEAKMWDETAEVRRLMKAKALKKDTGFSWTELKNKIYAFSSSGGSRFGGHDVYEVVDGLTAQLVDAGYTPNAMFSIHHRPAPCG